MFKSNYVDSQTPYTQWEIECCNDYYYDDEDYEICECSILNGRYHGIQKTWYKNGQLKDCCTKINMRIHGIKQDWHEDGRRISIRNRFKYEIDLYFRYAK